MNCLDPSRTEPRSFLLDGLPADVRTAYDPSASESQQRESIARLHGTLNAPTSRIRNRLLRVTADSPDLLAVIKEEGRV